MSDYLYRAFGRVDYSKDGYDLSQVHKTTIIVDSLPVLRRTTAGAWIAHPLTGEERWVATRGRKRFACPTEDEAIHSLMKRNKRRIQHLTTAMHKAKAIGAALDTALTIERLTSGCIRMDKE